MFAQKYSTSIAFELAFIGLVCSWPGRGVGLWLGLPRLASSI